MEYSDAQVNDCAERLSQLGIPVNGSTNPKVGYIKNPMACERCVYGSGEHAEFCEQHPDYVMNYAQCKGYGFITLENFAPTVGKSLLECSTGYRPR